MFQSGNKRKRYETIVQILDITRAIFTRNFRFPVPISKHDKIGTNFIKFRHFDHENPLENRGRQKTVFFCPEF